MISDPDVPPSRAALRRRGALSVVLVLAWGTVAAYAIHPALPYNPVELPLASEIQAQLWVPEGWGFFSRSPREEDLFPFLRRADGTWLPAHRGPHSSPAHLLGFNRASRAQGIELGLLLSGVPRSAWRSCEVRPEACLDQAPVAFSLRNASPDPTLCGAVAVALQRPVPWAWSTAQVIMPSRVVRLEVAC